MATHMIPRNTKGEGRILFIFSTKALIYTAIGAGIGYPIHYILNSLGIEYVGFIAMGFFALIGYSIRNF